MCEYCKGGVVTIGKTSAETLSIRTSTDGTRVLETECDPCPQYASCGLHHVPSRAVYLINFCPMCGRDLRIRTEDNNEI